MSDEFWDAEFDRWRARYDLLILMPAPDGYLRVCVSELARRWRWTPRRVRRLVEGVVAEGYLIHERRLSRGVLYRLCKALVDTPDTAEPEPEIEPAADSFGSVETPPEAAVELDQTEASGASLYRVETQAEAPAKADQIEPPRKSLYPLETPITPPTDPPPEPPPGPPPKARSSPLAPVLQQLTPSERSVAAEVLKCKPQLVDQMLEVWVEFKEIRHRCLSALEHEIPGCRLTERRAVRILDVLSSAGRDTVSEAVANLPYSHWHCATGRHAGSEVKLVPEAVFNAQQVQILSETPDKIPVWEQMGNRRPVQNWIDFDGRGKLVTFRRKDDVVPAGPTRALGVR